MSALDRAEIRRGLLAMARRSIADRLDGRALWVPPPLDRGPRQGVFVTLRQAFGNELRGCIGQFEPRHPLTRAVTVAACSAAFDDPRFPPVERHELPGLRLEISAIEDPKPMRPQEIRIGIHGVVVRGLGRGALMLPQVASEQGWDAATLLEKTCWKAGLPDGFWQRSDAVILGFTATVFGD